MKNKLYVAFSCPNKFKVGAAGISWWMNRPYSHVLIVFDYADSKSAVFHAAHGMVHFKSLNNFLKENSIVKKYEIELTEEQHTKFFDECMDLAGQKYSIKELAQILVTDLAYSAFDEDIGSSDMSGYICSELVGEFCIKTLKLDFSKPAYLLKPSDIDNKLALCPYTVTEYNK